MGRPPNEPDPGESPLALFAAEQRRYRHQAGLTQQQLGEKLNYTSALIGMIEVGARSPSEQYADRTDDILAADGGLRNCWQLLSRSPSRNWPASYDEVEAGAHSLRVWEWSAFPDLLQTEDYARALVRADHPDRSEELITSTVATRLKRQQSLYAAVPPTVWAVIDEHALTRPVGTESVMRDELAHLLDVAALPHVTVQILPFSAGAHPGRIGAYTVLDVTSAGTTTEIVWAEGPDGGHFTDLPERVTACTKRFEYFRALALSPTASEQMITTVAGA